MATIQIPSQEMTEFDLPRVCVITGDTEGVVFKDVKFQWYPRWIGALVIINLLVAAVVAMAMTKKVKGKLPFTEAGHAAWKKGQLMTGLSIVGALVMLVGAGFAFGNEIPALGVLLLGLMVAVPVAAYFLWAKGRRLGCTRIADGQITLSIPSEAAALAIRTHLHAGAVLPAQAAPAL